MKQQLSVSRVGTFRDCPRKYYNRYVKQLQRRRFKPAALAFGTAWHDWLECWHSGSGEPEWADVDDMDRMRLSHMAFGYINKWGREKGCSEVDCKLEMPVLNPVTLAKSRSFTFAGYLDGLMANEQGWRIFEHKTASTVNGNYLAKLWSDSQLSGYTALCEYNGMDIDHCVYDVVCKSRIKQKKGESNEEFNARHADIYMDGSMYHREIMPISKQQVSDWLRDLWQTTQFILMCQRTGQWPRNTGRCYDYYSECEFAALCQNGDSKIIADNEYEPRRGREENTQQVTEPVF
jgi:hypothetical protein